MSEVPSEHVVNFFGACHGGVEELSRFNECGARWKRGGSGWGDQQPAPDADYDFSDWDALKAEADRQNVRLFPVMNYTAEWASEAPDDENASHFPFREDRVEDWRAYVEAFVSHFDELTHFEIWNEPNLYHFLRVDDDEAAHEVYTDRVLIPAAEAIHEHGGKVVAPSITTEAWGWSVETNVENIDRWLNYRDAYEHVDYLSVHYVKGDTDKHGMEGADNLLPFYDHVYENYIAEGKLDGIWNTEGGFTAVEAGDQGFVSLEPWERKPYPQWAPKYTIPHIHWALDHEWEDRDDYKLFWYRMGTGPSGQGTLDACNLLEERGGERFRTDRARALSTTRDVLTAAETVDTYDEDVDVGFGLWETGVDEWSLSAWEFTSYAFDLDGDVLVAVWLDLPGIELTLPEVSKIQATVEGVAPDDDPEVETVDYVTGEHNPVTDYEFRDGTLAVNLPRVDDPVLYFKVSR